MKYDKKKVYGILELMVNIGVLGFNKYRKPAFVAQLCCAIFFLFEFLTYDQN